MPDRRPSTWRERAEKLRMRAATVKDPAARQSLLQTAEQWDRMASQLERTEAWLNS